MRQALKDIFRGLFLTDFWKDGGWNTRIGLTTTLFLNTARAAAMTLAPIFLSYAIERVATTNTLAVNDPCYPCFNTTIDKLKIFGLESESDVTPTSALYIWAGLIGAAHFLAAVNKFIASLIQMDLGVNLLNPKLLTKYHQLTFSYLDSLETNIPSLMLESTNTMSSLITKSIDEFVPMTMTLILVFSSAGTALSPGAVGGLVGYGIWNFLINIAYVNIQESVQAKTETKAENFRNVFQEDDKNREIIRVYRHTEVHRQHESKLFKQFTDRIFTNDCQPAAFKLVLIKAVFLGGCFLTVGLINKASNAIKKNELNELVLTINYLLLIHNASESFTTNTDVTLKGVGHLKKINTLLLADGKDIEMQVDPDQKVESEIRTSISTQPLIEFDHVKYTTKQGKTLVDDISFKIYRGQSCALVGTFGCGKTTILKLLCGIYQPTEGNICIDGININTKSLSWLRQQITWISQQAQLFTRLGHADSRLPFNVLYGHADDKELTALQVAEDERKPDLSGNLLTIFNQKKKCSQIDDLKNDMQNPSGGQQQGINFARGWRNAAPIMLLDEPTSAMDALSETQVITKFNEFVADKKNDSDIGVQAMIITAHRLKTIQASNQIFFMNDGRIVEQGSHDKLIQKNGSYAKHYACQNEEAVSFSLTPK